MVDSWSEHLLSTNLGPPSTAAASMFLVLAWGRNESGTLGKKAYPDAKPTS